MESKDRINIRPGVSILSVLRHLNYKPWFALAEFVDNSIQSYLHNLDALGGDQATLRVDIEVDTAHPGKITIRDNAAGIAWADYARAFRAAEIPPDRTGLSEFGMGMKSAACWFAPCWTVRTSALTEPVERTIKFDIGTIINDDIEEIDIDVKASPSNTHFTELALIEPYRTLQSRTISKIKEHLSSIFRVFIRSGILKLYFDGELLVPQEPKILVSPFYMDLSGPPIEWRSNFSFDFGLGLKASGFAALRETASTSSAGFALFRRNRLIEGSADETYRPEEIFGKPNSYRYQRLFGEIHLDGFEVSHTKDGFKWQDNEEAFLEFLEAELSKSELPLLEQAEGHRAKVAQRELKVEAEKATQRTALTMQRELSQVINTQTAAPPATEPLATDLPKTTASVTREFDVEHNDQTWKITLDLSTDPAISDWLFITEKRAENDSDERRIGVRIALAHPFMERFARTDASEIEALTRVGAALAIAEITARDRGVPQYGTIRRNVNQLLRDCFSKA
jgi:hypothetical protein